MKSLLSIPAVCSLFALTACNPMDELYGKIRDAGYIAFETPLSQSGPGTLVGGSPDRLSLVAGPQTCFPTEIDGQPTDLLRVDETALPQSSHRVTVSGNAKVGLVNFLSSGNPVLGAGLNFNHVETVEMKMEGVHVEYLDSVSLAFFYNERMSDVCKQFLDKVGFVIQAMKVERLEFKFFRKDGGGIALNLENLETIVDLEVGIDFTIEDNVSLVITSPKYIGYQLGRLRVEDGGMALYRATRVKNKKFLFESLDLFSSPPESEARFAFAVEADEQIMRLPDPHTLESVDRFSWYLK